MGEKIVPSVDTAPFPRPTRSKLERSNLDRENFQLNTSGRVRSMFLFSTALFYFGSVSPETNSTSEDFDSREHRNSVSRRFLFSFPRKVSIAAPLRISFEKLRDKNYNFRLKFFENNPPPDRSCNRKRAKLLSGSKFRTTNEREINRPWNEY